MNWILTCIGIAFFICIVHIFIEHILHSTHHHHKISPRVDYQRVKQDLSNWLRAETNQPSKHPAEPLIMNWNKPVLCTPIHH